MRGIENIVRMRLSGARPEFVNIELMPVADWAKRYTDHPGRFLDIHMTPDDVRRVQTADLRCLLGLNVVVNGDVATDAENVAKAVLKAGAKTVHAVVYDISNPYRIEVKEVMKWPQ